MRSIKDIGYAEGLLALKITAANSVIPLFAVTKETVKSLVKSKDNPPN